MGRLNPLLYSPFLLQSFIWPVTKVVFGFFLHIKISGLENLKHLDKGVIFVSNHSSELDPIIVPACLPFLSRLMPMFYVARPAKFYVKSGWRKIFYGGFLFKLWGAYPAIEGKHDYGLSLKSHLKILRHKKSILIFPEGHKTRTGEIMIEEVRGGASYLSEATGFPIVPILICGLYDMTCREFFLRKREVKVIFGGSITAREIFSPAFVSSADSNQYKSSMKNVMRIVKNLDGSIDSRQSVPTFLKTPQREKKTLV